MAEFITECKQDSKGRYLVVAVQADWKAYKEEMLINNNITGLLPASVQALDNQRQVWYETTGKQSLKELFSQKAPGEEEIGKLLKQIEETGKRVEEYLLESDDLVLDISYIYGTGDGNYSFLYLPDYQKNVGEQLQLLLEGLMEYMDYGNRQAVSLVYLLHARSKQKDGGILEIRRLCEELLCAEAEEEKGEDREEGEEESKKEKEEENRKSEYVVYSNHPAGQGNVQGSYLKENGAAFARKSWKEKLGEKIKALWGKMTASIEEEDEDSLSDLGLQDEGLFSSNLQDNMPFATKLKETVQQTEGQQETIFLSGRQQDTVLLSGKPQDTVLLSEKPQDTIFLSGKPQDTVLLGEKPQDTIFLSGKPQDTVLLSGKPQDTVLLTGNSQNTVLLTGNSRDTMSLTEGFQPELPRIENQQTYFLQPLEEGEERIPIHSFPFQIGKEKTGGHIFRDPVISRCHAKIEQEQGGFYLTDLASLNGTFLNGERLRPNERRKIVSGDILGFADIFYIFTCSKAIDVI